MAGRVLYGEWNPNWQVGAGVDNNVITARDADMGHQVDIVHWFAASNEGFVDYDYVMTDAAISLGRIPFVSWGLAVPLDVTDAQLDDWANGMKARAPNTILIRLFWEFNDAPTGTNTSWGVCQSSRTPSQLITAWQHVVDRFRTDGATNVKFVWNPDGTMGLQMYGNVCGSLSTAYPGDSYVDYIGFDTYGYDNQAQYSAVLSQTGTSKPLILGEVGDTDTAGGSSWVNTLSSLLNGGQLANVAGVVWFNDLGFDFPSNPSTKAAVKSMLATTAFTSADTTPPTVPSSLSAVAASATRVNLSWNAATDNVAVAGYDVYRGGVLLATLAATALSYADTTVAASTSYSYTVDAFDAAGNHSAQSTAASVTTPAASYQYGSAVYGSAVYTASTGISYALTAVGSEQSAGTVQMTAAAASNALAAVGSSLSTGVGGLRQIGLVAAAGAGLSSGSGTLLVSGAPQTLSLLAAGNALSSGSGLINLLASLDTSPPSVPSGLVASAQSPSRVLLSWQASIDNVGVKGYTVYRNSSLIDVVTSPSYIDDGVLPGLSYSWRVDAFDAAGNRSAQSTSTALTTPTIATTASGWPRLARISVPFN